MSSVVSAQVQPGDEQGGRSPRRYNATDRTTQMLRNRLSKGTLTVGGRLPSEPALATELGVSRVTVRAALSRLEGEGLVTRRHGLGTFVSSVRPLVTSLHVNIGADALITSSGRVAGIAEMAWRHRPADEEVAQRLGVDIGTPIVHLYRVRTADGAAVTIANDYFLASLLPDEPIVMGPSLYAFLSQVCGVDVTFGVAMVEPAVAGDEFGEVFDVGPDALCLVLRQVDYDADERPVSYSVEHHLASAFDFQLIRQGPASQPGRTAAG